jgi:hypothetical protein
MSPYTKNLTLSSKSIYYPKNGVIKVLKNHFVLNVALTILVFVSLLIYLFEVNQLIVFSFKLKELKEKKEKLEEINKSLELNKLKLESLNNIQNYLDLFGLVKTEKVEYIKNISSMALTKK